LTADDTWVHHFEPETKSRTWKGIVILNLLGSKNFGKSSIAGIKITVFLDCGGVIIVTDVKRGNYFRCLLQAVERTRESFHTCSPVPPNCFAVLTDSSSVVTEALWQGVQQLGREDKLPIWK
jgi:hypothetical protein